MKQEDYSPVCSWCLKGEKSIGISFEERLIKPKKSYTVAVSLCAKCFYAALIANLGAPKNAVLGAMGSETPGICN